MSSTCLDCRICESVSQKLNCSPGWKMVMRMLRWNNCAISNADVVAISNWDILFKHLITIRHTLSHNHMACIEVIHWHLKCWRLTQAFRMIRTDPIIFFHLRSVAWITLTLYMVLQLFSTRFADYAGGIRVSFIQPRLFHFHIKFCVRDISYRLIWMKYINMFSVYAQSGTHSRFDRWIIVVST